MLGGRDYFDQLTNAVVTPPSINDTLNAFHANSKFGSNGRNGLHLHPILVPYSSDQLGGNSPAGPLEDRVVEIIHWSSKKQMIRPDTRSVIATGTIMADQHSLWNPTIYGFPSESTGPDLPTIHLNPFGVTVLIERTSPNPTALRFGHPFPEPDVLRTRITVAGVRTKASRLVKLGFELFTTCCAGVYFRGINFLRHSWFSQFMFRALKGLGSLELPAYYTTA